MHNRTLIELAGAACLVFLLTIAAIAAANGSETQPAYWVENDGQYDDRVLFRSEGPGETAWLLEDEIWLTYFEGSGAATGGTGPRFETPEAPARIQNIRITLEDSNGSAASARVVPADPVEIHRTFLTPAGLFENVPLWGSVRYEELIPGLEVVLSTDDVGVRIELEAAGAETEVRIRVDGADELKIVDGRLVVVTEFGERVLPFDSNSENLVLTASGPAGKWVSFRPAGHAGDSAVAAEVPAAGTLVYSSFFGTAGQHEFGAEIVSDPDGYAYTAGASEAPTTAFTGRTGLQTPLHLVSAFVIKVDPAGASAEYLTSITGADPDGEDYALDLVLDADKNIYVTGLTSSEDFPTTPGAFDQTHNGGLNDAWLVKLNPAGGVVFSTLVGSGGNDWANAVGLGLFGDIFITGFTSGPDFPKTAGSFDPTHNGGFDIFVSKFTNDGSTLIAGTFVGGSGDEGGDFSLDRSDIHVDVVGTAVVTGPTESANFPVTNSPIGPGGCKDIFITKLTPSLTDIFYSARIGGSGTNCGVNGDDNAERLTLDGPGNIYITGYTSTNQGQGFPVTANAYDTTFNGVYDAFLLKFNPTTFDVRYGTYLGGSSFDVGKDVQVGRDGTIYLTGYTFSANFPVSGDAYDSTLGGESDVYITQINPLAFGPADLVYSTFFGGGGWDWGVGLDAFGEDILFLTGFTQSSGFPITAGSYQETYSGDRDAYISRFHLNEPSPPHPRPTWTPAPFNIEVPVSLQNHK
jgi:hypothetical protein